MRAAAARLPGTCYAAHCAALLEECRTPYSATALAGASRACKSIVLLGDQNQLPAPSEGHHPGESGASCLEYLLRGADCRPDALIACVLRWRSTLAIQHKRTCPVLLQEPLF